MSPRSLFDLTYQDLESALTRDGIRPFHARQLFRSLYQQLDDPPTAPGHNDAPLRAWLDNHSHHGHSPAPLFEATQDVASSDGFTRKFLLKLRDGQTIESVLMGFTGRYTGCISTQAGCAMGCVFCATGHMGFIRHLTAGEIVSQAVHLQRQLQAQGDERLRNLVFMGMGEPLHNYENLQQALAILTDNRGLGFGPARITISTVGHVPGILRLAREPKRYNLAISLHGSTDEERSALVPINNRWPLADLLAAVREYQQITGERVFFAWTLIKGKNDSPTHAQRIAALLRGLDAHVNLIPLNPTTDYAGAPPEAREVDEFQRILLASGIPSTIRQRRGIDVGAGCGQLRSENIRRSSRMQRAETQ